jgi:hypothetical protein
MFADAEPPAIPSSMHWYSGQFGLGRHTSDQVSSVVELKIRPLAPAVARCVAVAAAFPHPDPLDALAVWPSPLKLLASGSPMDKQLQSPVPVVTDAAVAAAEPVPSYAQLKVMFQLTSIVMS